MRLVMISGKVIIELVSARHESAYGHLASLDLPASMFVRNRICELVAATRVWDSVNGVVANPCVPGYSR